MANMVAKTMTVTRVTYSLAVVEDGQPKFISCPLGVFKGNISQEKALKQLKAIHGKDANILICNIEGGTHKFAMPMEDFVRASEILDDDPCEGPGDDTCDETPEDEPEIAGVSDKDAELALDESPSLVP